MVIFRNKSRDENFRVCMGIFTAALRNKRCWQILHKNTSPYFHSAMLVLWPFTLFQRGHFSALSISKFTTPKRRTWKWITRQNGLLITKWAVRQQAMQCEVFLFIIWLNFNLWRAVVNIPSQILIFSPRLVFRKMIISQLELGLPVILCHVSPQSRSIYICIVTQWSLLGRFSLACIWWVFYLEMKIP